MKTISTLFALSFLALTAHAAEISGRFDCIPQEGGTLGGIVEFDADTNNAHFEAQDRSKIPPIFLFNALMTYAETKQAGESEYFVYDYLDYQGRFSGQFNFVNPEKWSALGIPASLTLTDSLQNQSSTAQMYCTKMQ